MNNFNRLNKSLKYYEKLNENDTKRLEEILSLFPNELYSIYAMYYEGYKIYEIAEYQNVTLYEIENKLIHIVTTIDEKLNFE